MDKKAHALHNESACNFLQSDGSFCDWVVTTAFYSSLHFLQNEMFPIHIDGIEYNSFDNYYNIHYRGKKNKPNKHVSTLNLVKSELGDNVYQNYNWLFGLCMNARYNDYNVHKLISTEAIKRLEKIKTTLKK